MGTTLREIIYAIGGGIPRNRRFKAAQLGGPSGGCLPAKYLDLPIDYDSVKQVGAIMGSGGMIVMDESTCMVDIARYFLDFTQSESCGKCVPCRVGTRHMLDILTRICAGRGKMEDLDELERLGDAHQVRLAVRAGADGPQPGADHAPVLPRRIRGAHPLGALPGLGLRGAGRLALCPRLSGPRERSAVRGTDRRRAHGGGGRRDPAAQPVRLGLRPRLRPPLRAPLPPRRVGRAAGDPRAEALRRRSCRRVGAARLSRPPPAKRRSPWSARGRPG